MKNTYSVSFTNRRWPTPNYNVCCVTRQYFFTIHFFASQRLSEGPTCLYNYIYLLLSSFFFSNTSCSKISVTLNQDNLQLRITWQKEEPALFWSANFPRLLVDTSYMIIIMYLNIPIIIIVPYITIYPHLYITIYPYTTPYTPIQHYTNLYITSPYTPIQHHIPLYIPINPYTSPYTPIQHHTPLYNTIYPYIFP